MVESLKRKTRGLNEQKTKVDLIIWAWEREKYTQDLAFLVKCDIGDVM